MEFRTKPLAGTMLVLLMMTTGTALADEKNASASSGTESDYSSAIESFGVKPAAAVQAAKEAKEQIAEIQRQNNKDITVDALAGIPLDLLDQPMY